MGKMCLFRRVDLIEYNNHSDFCKKLYTLAGFCEDKVTTVPEVPDWKHLSLSHQVTFAG